MSWLLTIFTGPLSIPAKLFLVLAPAVSVKGLPVISCPPMYTRTVAVEVLTFANRNCVSRLTLLYQGSQ
jgi:hypothetical protein